MGSQSHYRAISNDDTVIYGNKLKPEDKRGSFIIKPKALDIIWGADSRYWRLPSSRDDEPVELLQVCWLEVSGSLDLQKLQAKTYKLTFKVSMKPDAFGWRGSPVYLMAKVGTNKYIWKSHDLSTLQSGNQIEIPSDLKFSVEQKDRDANEKLRFGIYEIWRGRWKGGLVIHEVRIVPEDASPS